MQAFGPVKAGLGMDRRNTATGVPQRASDGDVEMTVVIGIDSEWVNQADTVLSPASNFRAHGR